MKKAINLTAALGIPPLPAHSSETIGALLWAREVLQQHLTTTYAVSDPKGIEELKPVKIGGINQWLHIRGRNRHNPVLLYLHGGPGGPMIGTMDATMRPWEDYFTIVHWDQRQTGKSFYPANDETDPLTVQGMVEDTEAVIQYLRRYLKQDKLFLLGHSWGSVLGMHMVKRRPDWLHAYIGVGQVVNGLNGEKVLYERLLSHARKQKDNKLVAKLEAITPKLDADSPERERSYMQNCVWVRRELTRLAGESTMRHLSLDDCVKMMAFDQLISPHLTLTDLTNAKLGGEVAILRPPYTLAKEFLDIDLPNDVGSSFEVPIFFFTGAHDWQTPWTLSDQWFSQIDTSYKELIHFEESSHFIVNEEPGKVLTALVNKVLPCAQPEMDQEANNA